MFVGTHHRAIDMKWRLSLPAELFGPTFEGDRDSFYFASGGDHLILMSSRYFQQLAEQVLAKSVMAHRDLRRKFFGNTYAKQLDKNGRIQIPEPLREKCGLGDRPPVVIVGTGPYAELRPATDAPQAPEAEEMCDVLDQLEALGG